MKNNDKNSKNCYLCHKKLNFWITSGKRYEGHKICSSCGMKIANKDLKKSFDEIGAELKNVKVDLGAKNQGGEDLATRINRVGMRLTIHLTLPIILFFIGIFTFPIGLLFWLLGLVLLAGLFKTDQK